LARQQPGGIYGFDMLCPTAESCQSEGHSGRNRYGERERERERRENAAALVATCNGRKDRGREARSNVNNEHGSK
jgi:hypothetical protein